MKRPSKINFEILVSKLHSLIDLKADLTLIIRYIIDTGTKWNRGKATRQEL